MANHCDRWTACKANGPIILAAFVLVWLCGGANVTLSERSELSDQRFRPAELQDRLWLVGAIGADSDAEVAIAVNRASPEVPVIIKADYCCGGRFSLNDSVSRKHCRKALRRNVQPNSWGASYAMSVRGGGNLLDGVRGVQERPKGFELDTVNGGDGDNDMWRTARALNRDTTVCHQESDPVGSIGVVRGVIESEVVDGKPIVKLARLTWTTDVPVLPTNKIGDKPPAYTKLHGEAVAGFVGNIAADDFRLLNVGHEAWPSHCEPPKQSQHIHIIFAALPREFRENGGVPSR